MGNLFQSEIKSFDTFKTGFCAQKGPARPCSRLPFRVGHHVCPAHLGLPPSHPSLTFDRTMQFNGPKCDPYLIKLVK